MEIDKMTGEELLIVRGGQWVILPSGERKCIITGFEVVSKGQAIFEICVFFLL